MTNTSLIEETELKTELGNSDHAHVVDRGDDERPIQAIILEARVNGTPLTAVCGYTWVPHKDPQKLPVCPKCLEILEFVKDVRGFNGVPINGIDK